MWEGALAFYERKQYSKNKSDRLLRLLRYTLRGLELLNGSFSSLHYLYTRLYIVYWPLKIFGGFSPYKMNSEFAGEIVYTTKFSYTTFIPTQVTPSLVVPNMHTHVKLPSVLLQVESTGQIVADEHSSISID